MNAFANRTDIKTVKTAEGCSITEIGGNAFSGCNYLKTASLSGVSGNVGSRTFFACTSLTDVSISGNTISLDANAFFYCNMLRQVSFNANIGTVKSSAISDCQLLEKVSIRRNRSSADFRPIDHSGGGAEQRPVSFHRRKRRYVGDLRRPPAPRFVWHSVCRQAQKHQPLRGSLITALPSISHSARAIPVRNGTGFLVCGRKKNIINDCDE